LRRTTLALTTTILGAVLTAPSVWAQQLTPTGNDPTGKSTQPDAATAESAPLYGITTSRGARYLLRNGLDYLGYQQYERSLKFLREAESRKKELNDAEKLALKQGIERAQRGLREAADAQFPYALSERSRRRNGFSPAKPETQVVAGTNQVPLQARKTKTNRIEQPTLLGNDGEDQGEPVRLASGEMPGNSISQNTIIPQSTWTTRPEPEQPRSFPEIPKLPTVPQLTELTESKSTVEQRTATVDPKSEVTVPGTAPLDSPAVPPPLVPATEPAQSTEGSVADPSNRWSALAGADTKQPLLQEDTRANARAENRAELIPAQPPTPTSGQGTEQSAGQVSEVGMLVSPVPSKTAPTSGTASIPFPVPQTTETFTSYRVVQPPSVSHTSPANPNPAVLNLETIPSSIPVDATAQPTGMDTVAHKETDDAEPASMPDRVRDISAATTSAITRQTASPVSNDELPRLPTDIGNPDAPSPTSDTARTPPAASNFTITTPAVADELPPLPADIGRSALPKLTADTARTPSAVLNSSEASPAVANELPPLPADMTHSTSPKPTSDEPVTSLVAPTPLLVSSNVTPDASQTPTVATSSPVTSLGGTNFSAPSRTEEDTLPPLPPLPPLPGGNEGPSRANAARGSSHSVDGGSAATSVQTVTREATISGPDPIGGSNLNSAPTDIKLRALAERNAVVATGPASQPYPATNANLAEVPAAAPRPHNGTGADSDASSIPPAIEDQGPIESKSKSYSPERFNSHSILGPDLQREVEMIARNQEAESRTQRNTERQPAGITVETSVSDPRTQFQLDTSRAPSPAEARPIRAIPVPEDWVPLAPRNWSPQRKYWAAAATCHLPLYFQDPVLERYGHSVEQFVGPLGQYLTYPVDDPTQSTQRNQILQPFFSAGLFGLQIVAWPYNLIMDPPWEAQYDLGYYRPGDNIPTDIYWLPLHGYGPPLRGSRY